jgi:hypothetical protein
MTRAPEIDENVLDQIVRDGFAPNDSSDVPQHLVAEASKHFLKRRPIGYDYPAAKLVRLALHVVV